MQIKPYHELLKMTDQQIDAEMAPIREKEARAKADQKLSECARNILTKQREVTKFCTDKEIDFDKIADALDDIEMAERRKEQIEGIVNQLFPKE
jgi:hypothetical protein